MPERVTFVSGERALASDLTEIGVKSETGFLTLAQAIIGSSTGQAIFNASVNATIVVAGGGPYSVDAGEIFFAADGFVGRIPGPFSAPYAANSDLYAVIERYVDNDSRVVASGAPPIEATVGVDVAMLEDFRYEVHPTATPPSPTLGGAVHYIRVAALTTVPAKAFDPDGLIYTFPGDTIPVGPHAATHLPVPFGTGTDPILVANTGSSPSEPGLLGEGELDTVRAAITAIAPAAGSPITVATAGDNTPIAGPAKTVELDIATGDGLSVAAGALFVAFSGTGAAPFAARSDHQHTFLSVESFTLLPATSLPNTLHTVTTTTLLNVKSAQMFYTLGTKRVLLPSAFDADDNGAFIAVDGLAVKVLYAVGLIRVPAVVSVFLGGPNNDRVLSTSDSGMSITVEVVGEKTSS